MTPCCVCEAQEKNALSPADDDDDAGEVVEMDSGGEGGEELKDKASSSETAEDKVYIPGQPLDEGEELVHDNSAYHMYHAVSLEYRNRSSCVPDD